MRKNQFLLIIVLLLTSCFLMACGPKPTPTPTPTPTPEIDWDSKEILDIKAVNETFTTTYEYDEFELGMLKIHITYTDQTSRDISVDESMLSDKDLGKLKTTGTPRITIEYAGFSLQMKVKLTDSSRLDENLNIDGLYACVIKAIRDKEKEVINFYIEANDDYTVCAFNFAFTYDSSIMQVSNPTVNASLTGIGDVLLSDNKIIFAYSENAKAMEGESLLFSVSYTGDYRNSKLAIDETYQNVVYEADMQTYETSLVTNILYHVSVK